MKYKSSPDMDMKELIENQQYLYQYETQIESQTRKNLGRKCRGMYQQGEEEGEDGTVRVLVAQPYKLKGTQRASSGHGWRETWGMPLLLQWQRLTSPGWRLLGFPFSHEWKHNITQRVPGLCQGARLACTRAQTSRKSL